MTKSAKRKAHDAKKSEGAPPSTANKTPAPTGANKWAQPQEVTQLAVAFGGPEVMRDLLPPMSVIPKEFDDGDSPYLKVVSMWFYGGLKASTLVPREGIDKTKAIRHLQACLGSFEPKHEHKTAGVAYLMSQWFTIAGAP